MADEPKRSYRFATEQPHPDRAIVEILEDDQVVRRITVPVKALAPLHRED
jgi:hypothetical protein